MKTLPFIVIGVAIAAVVLATMAFTPIPAPPAPAGYVVVCGAPPAPAGFVLVCYDQVRPGLDEIARWATVLSINLAALALFGRAIADAARPAEAN